MTSSQFLRIYGLALLIGAVAFVVHTVLRSLITAGLDPSVFAKEDLWVPLNVLGVMGTALVLLGLPAMHSRMAGPAGLFGIVLIAVAWIFFGVFLSLFSMLVLPWLTDKAPLLVGISAPLPAGFVIAFIVALIAWFVGTVLLAIPFIMGKLQPRWVGYVLPTSALWVVVGDLIIAPSGPAPYLLINLLSNLGPVLLLVALGSLGSQMWSEHYLGN
jgi:hypothetical protein